MTVVVGDADMLIEQIAEKRLEMKNVLADYDTTLEYNANRPLFEENQKLRELVKVKRERDMYISDAMEMAILIPEAFSTKCHS